MNERLLNVKALLPAEAGREVTKREKTDQTSAQVQGRSQHDVFTEALSIALLNYI